MKKGVGAELILTIGILLATGITMLQLKGVFYGQQRIAKEEVVYAFAEDLQTIIDEATKVTGNATFAYYPSIKKYVVVVEESRVMVHDKISKKNTSFIVTSIHLIPNRFEDSKIIYVSRVEDSVYITPGECEELGQRCDHSIDCCSGYCWGDSFGELYCKDVCAPLGSYTGDDISCCSGYLDMITQRCEVRPTTTTSTSTSTTVPAGVTTTMITTTTLPSGVTTTTTGIPECPLDSPCRSYWPSHQGPKIRTGNERSHTCDIFEVCHPDLQWIVKEAEKCCENCNLPKCHNYCDNARNYADLDIEETPDNFKKCKGLYVIYGFGPAKKYMVDYFWPELSCVEDKYVLPSNGGECLPSDLGKCSCDGKKYNENAEKLPCVGPVAESPEGWLSNDDMSKNSCAFSDLQAHVSINILNTGTCVDYSSALTTILRMIGYSKNEVFSISCTGHSFNIVLFPGKTKWSIVDTVGNVANPYVPGGIPLTRICDYCEYRNCRNDAGISACPKKSQIIGC